MNGSIALHPSDNNLRIIYDLTQKCESSPVSSVLDLVVSITNSDAAHLYRMDPAAHELRLVSASPALEDSRIHRVSLQFSASLQKAAVFFPDDPGYASFPETVASEVASLLAVPLHAEPRLAGILTLSRKDSRPYGMAEIATAAKVGDALVSAMRELECGREADALRAKLRSARQENLLLEKRLAERKLVERAKGLLQAHYGWSEEDAYYHLRRTSRRQRTPMAVIAQRIVEGDAPIAAFSAA